MKIKIPLKFNSKKKLQNNYEGTVKEKSWNNQLAQIMIKFPYFFDGLNWIFSQRLKLEKYSVAQIKNIFSSKGFNFSF